MTLSDEREDKYTRWLAAIEQGATVRDALKEVGWHWRSAQLAITHDDSTLARYALARKQSALFWADKAVHATEGITPDWAPVARVQSEVYKWRARVANPKEYGDKVEVESTGTIQHLHLAALQAANAQRINALPPVTARIASPDTAIPRIGEAPPDLEATGRVAEGGSTEREPPVNVVPAGMRLNGMGKVVPVVHAVGAESRVRALASDGGDVDETVEGGIGGDGGEEPPFEVVEDGE